MKTNLLFSAPLDFDPAVADLYRQISHGDPFEVMGVRPKQTQVWVVNPKQNFVVDERVLALFPNLKIIATPSTGTNHIDLQVCKDWGIKVLSLLDDRDGLDRISASAEFTFKLILDALRLPVPRELQERRVGFVGYGRIGRRVSRWCADFGAQIVGFYDPRIALPTMVTQSLKDIFKKSEVVVICCSLTPETRGMIRKEHILCLEHACVLVNTARGEIINEEDLISVMQERPDLKIALDVVSGEAQGTANPDRLRRLGAIVTDHVAGETYDSRTKAARIIYNLIVREL